jgi:flagellar motor component MotA
MSKQNIFGAIIWIAALALMTTIEGMRVFAFVNIPALLWVSLGVIGALLITKDPRQSHDEKLRIAAQAAWMSGIISFIVGLVVVLGNLDDPKMIGPNLAVALLSVLYAAIVSLVCNTLALRHEAKKERWQPATTR